MLAISDRHSHVTGGQGEDKTLLIGKSHFIDLILLFLQARDGSADSKEVAGKNMDPETFVGDPEMLIKHPLQVKRFKVG